MWIGNTFRDLLLARSTSMEHLPKWPHLRNEIGCLHVRRRPPAVRKRKRSCESQVITIRVMQKCIYHGLCNLFFGVLHGMLFCCFISGRLYIFELFSFIFIRVLQPSLRPQNYVWCWRRYLRLCPDNLYRPENISLKNGPHILTLSMIKICVFKVTLLTPMSENHISFSWSSRT